MDETGLDPTERLRALTADLRRCDAAMRADFTPEVIASLTGEQRAELRAQLERLRAVSGKTLRDIEVYLAGQHGDVGEDA